MQVKDNICAAIMKTAEILSPNDCICDAIIKTKNAASTFVAILKMVNITDILTKLPYLCCNSKNSRNNASKLTYALVKTAVIP